MKSLGYLGPDGTFTQQAAEVYVRYNARHMVEYSSIQDILKAVDCGEIDEGIVPIENSIEGAVNATMDMLAHEVDLLIQAELVLPVQQCLMALPSISIDEITDVISHPQALAQCRTYLQRYLAKAAQHTASSTAAAAKVVAQSSGQWAAIAMPAAAKRWGLNILAQNIQDNDDNATRFIVLGKVTVEPTGRDKTSIVFSTEDTPGSLYRMLKVFADNGINLTRIESRPAKKILGQYLFFVDLIGHIEDDIVRRSLEIISKNSNFYKYLGSYPQWDSQKEV